MTQLNLIPPPVQMGPLRSLEEEAGSHYLPPWRAEQLARVRKKAVRLALASNWSRATPEVLRILATDRTIDVRRAVASNPKSPIDVLDALVQDPDPDTKVQGRVAENAKASQNALTLLAGGPRLSPMYLKVLQHPHCPPEILTAALAWTLAENPRSAGDTERHLKIRKAIAGNPNFPDSLAWAIDVPEAIVRIRAAENPVCSTEVLTILAADSELWVVRAVATNPHCPPELLAQWIHSSDIDLFKGAAENPSTPTDAWPEDISMWDEFYKRIAYEGKHTPVAVLAKLAQLDASRRVRAAAAANPNCSQELLRSLADAHPTVVVGVLANPNCHVDLLERTREQVLQADEPQLREVLVALNSITLPSDAWKTPGQRSILRIRALLVVATHRAHMFQKRNAWFSPKTLREAEERLGHLEEDAQTIARYRQFEAAGEDWQIWVAPYGPIVEQAAWAMLCAGFTGSIRTLAEVTAGAVLEPV